ncbi:hypothetical protein FA95DRAFT_1548537 [Auriscalpium vulgare]|uniref:Uncharacterized protein n=1 Tax=Auriscalpium vulgare TaxID=40419 RepID=A0ACB8RDD1_9AGAM|nr:hypothetical protein FA95DRAFT_1548537 [Auriscalpium vulgare]
MSNDSRSDQIVSRFYTKLAGVVHNARATAQLASTKTDKWFNLETPEVDAYRDALQIYRGVSRAQTPIPPLNLYVLLCIPDPAPTRVLVVYPRGGPRLVIDPAPRFVLLESWQLDFRQLSSEPDHAAHTIYKHGIALFRSLYALLRVLPAWNMHKRSRRRGFTIEVSAAPVEGVLAFDTPPVPGVPPLPHASHAFPSIPHPFGTFGLSVEYLTQPDFKLEERETTLSSRFFSLDEGPDFTPTLAKNAQRDSMYSSPGSLPLRTSLPASPPSMFDRMVRQNVGHTRTTSFPGSSPGSRATPLPMSRVTSGTGGNVELSGLSAGSSRLGAASRDDGHPILPAIGTSRLRKESTTSLRSPDLPSSPGALPIRRPPANALPAFKSSTLSSGSPSLHSPSPSLRQTSPLAGALPSRPFPSPSSSRMPPSPIGKLSSPAPSLGDRRSLHSEGGSLVGGEGRSGPKRYSSSFGHRYKDSAGGASEMSAGSADRKESDKGGSPSYLSANADEEDLSAFMNDTSQPKPLNRRYRSQNADPNRDLTLPSRDSEPSPGSSLPRPGVPFGQESPDPTLENALGLGVGVGLGPMLTSEAAVDDQLRRMNETFLATLEMVGGGRRRERTFSSPASRAERISEVSEPSATSAASGSRDVSRNSSLRSDMGRGRGLRELIPRRPGSRTDSIASEEVIGKLELDDERRRSMGR